MGVTPDRLRTKEQQEVPDPPADKPLEGTPPSMLHRAYMITAAIVFVVVVGAILSAFLFV